MPEYLLELYVPRADAHVAANHGQSARAGAEELTGRGRPVRYRWSIFVPAEETCFVLFEAQSADAVRAAARLAALPCERVSTAITHSLPEAP
jgi:hypothetical protein